MSNVNKHEAMCTYLRQCSEISSKDLYFNFSECNIGDVVIATNTVDSVVESYIDGSSLKWYDFAIIQYMSATTNPNTTGNTTSIYDFDKIIEWVNEQDDLENYPSFGSNCDIRSIEALQNIPTVAGKNQTSAKYMVLCRVEYVERI